MKKKINYINKLLIGDWIEVLKTLPDNTYHCCITSPPYWMQRNYGVKNQLGMEKTPELHIEKLVTGFREVKRVLRDDGVFWLNYGDKYSGAGGESKFPQNDLNNKILKGCASTHGMNIDNGNLLGLAWRLALALQADGWILRSDVIWAKGTSFCDEYAGSCMPESVSGTRWERHKIKIKAKNPREKRDMNLQEVAGHFLTHRADGSKIESRGENAVWKDCPGCPKCEKNNGYVLRKGSWRCTRGHEYVFQFSKNTGYYSDMEAIKQEYKYDGRQDTALKPTDKYGNRNYGQSPNSCHSEGAERWPGNGKNLRDVWLINPHGYADAHYATFPPSLVEPMIKASTSEKGVCPKCGSQWARVLKMNDNYVKFTKAGGALDLKDKPDGISRRQRKGHPSILPDKYSTIDWKATCTCGIEETIPALVLDCFMGSGTVALMAEQLKRNYTGIDISEKYIKEHAELRIKERKTGIEVKHQKQGFKGLFE